MFAGKEKNSYLCVSKDNDQAVLEKLKKGKI